VIIFTNNWNGWRSRDSS